MREKKGKERGKREEGRNGDGQGWCVKRKEGELVGDRRYYREEETHDNKTRKKRSEENRIAEKRQEDSEKLREV